MANKWLSEVWIEKNLKVQLKVRKELVEIAKEIDKVKDKKTLLAFASKIVGLKDLSEEELVVVAMLDPRLALEGESYVKELETYDFENPSVIFKPLIYINTIGADINDEIYRQRALEEEAKKKKKLGTQDQDEKNDESSAPATPDGDKK